MINLLCFRQVPHLCDIEAAERQVNHNRCEGK